MNNLLDLSPLFFDETDDIHRTDYLGSWADLYLAKHVVYFGFGSTTMEVTKN